MEYADSAEHQLPAQLMRVHMVGIGGAGMSGLARLLLSRGAQVSGSDAKDGRTLLDLATRGAQIRIGHDAKALDLLPGGPTVVLTTHAAVPKDNPELVEARRRGIPIVLRPEVLATLMRGYRRLLICGTHGKTSTTSMAVIALQHCGFDPSFAVGGQLNDSGTNAHHGSGDVFVAEADESDGSLLEYEPDVVVVTNIEADHLDHFGTEEAYVQVFDDFLYRIRPGGAVIFCLDDIGAAELAGRNSGLLKNRGVRVLGYGRGDYGDRARGVQLIAELMKFVPRGMESVASVKFSLNSEIINYDLALGIPGIHMARNAIGATLGIVCLGAELDVAIAGIETFTGVNRRFQLRGTVAGIDVIDDYAHHPTELRAVLNAAREIVVGKAKVLAVFQPHLYSRTQTFVNEFAQALDLADHTIVMDVYGAREQPIAGVSGLSIVEKMTSPAQFQSDMSALPKQIAALAATGDIILMLGAGDITLLGSEILAALAAREGDESG